jgi:AAA15 family ATPase/GTPase
MLLEFSVKNFLSYKEKMTLSFEATKDKTLEEYYCYKINEKTRVLKLGIIYGANASGKTNILKAIDFIRKAVIHPKRFDDNTNFIPFKFDNNTIQDAGEFEVIFFKNSIRYDYQLKLNNHRIIEESLSYYPKGQPTNIFSRKLDEIKYNSTYKGLKLYKKDRDALDSNTVSTMTLLSALQVTKINVPALQNAFEWFSKDLMPIVRQNSDLKTWTVQRIEQDNDNIKKLTNLLRKADFNINDIYINTDEIIMNKELSDLINNSNMPDSLKNNILTEGKLSSIELLLNHIIINNGIEQVFKLDFNEESDGTQRYFELGGALNELLMKDHILPIDEIERSLHPDLVKHFIYTFLRNSNRSQLIVTTHNIDFISNTDEIRKDVVWFTDKQVDGSTDLYSLADFPEIRKNMSYLKAYKSGKLGAVPNLGSTLIDLGDGDGKKE